MSPTVFREDGYRFSREEPRSHVHVQHPVGEAKYWLEPRIELDLAFETFPWFKDAPLGQILNVELSHPEHLCWPDLDVDLAIESIEHPERFPLVSRARAGTALQRPRATRAKKPPRRARR